jgi:Protein of unknown function (DUF1419)
MRDSHFRRLGAYRNSKEYAEYAREIGNPAPVGELPSLIGDRWEIDEETYMEFLEILPPLAYRGKSFYMSEFCFGDVTTKYTKEGDKYYCEFAKFPERAAEAVTATHIDQQEEERAR